MPYAKDFLRVCNDQAGDAYVWGTEPSVNDPDPDAFDCSELVQWGLFRVGLSWVDGSWIQEQACEKAGTMTPVAEAIRTPGALLFRYYSSLGRVGHVAISRGDGSTIEARGRQYGTNIFNAHGRFTSAGLVPNLIYGREPPKPHPGPSPEEVMPTFIVDPKDPSPTVGRTRGWRLVKQLRAILAVNGAPLAGKKHDKAGRAVMVIPAKYGEIIDMDLAADKSGLVVLMADDGTIDIPLRKDIKL